MKIHKSLLNEYRIKKVTYSNNEIMYYIQIKRRSFFIPYWITKDLPSSLLSSDITHIERYLRMLLEEDTRLFYLKKFKEEYL